MCEQACQMQEFAASDHRALLQSLLLNVFTNNLDEDMI